MEQDDVELVVEEARQRFVAAFPSRYDLLTVLVESATSRDPDAVLDLHQTAHRLVGRAGAIQFLDVARHAATLEGLTADPAAFSPAAASHCLTELWAAFTSERDAARGVAPIEPGVVHVRQTVLIADDDEDQHFLISRLLKRAGFEVVIATRGAEVPEIARERRPAAILLDVQMPDQDGFTTARQLKNDPETAFIPLMFLTGRADVDDRLAGLQIGADDYVSKSVDPRELVLRVQKLCTRSSVTASDRTPGQPWLDRAQFEATTRDRLAGTWGTLVLVKGPASDSRAGAFFAEQLRRRDLVGDLEDGRWACFLTEEAASVVGARMSALLKKLQATLQKPLHAGLAASTAPGGSLDALLEQADVNLAHARARGQVVVEQLERGEAAAVPLQKTVLLTDDDPEVTRITDAHVRAAGYRTHLAFDGAQAIQSILAMRPDAVVLDLMLPKRTGFDVLGEIQQMPPPRPRVIVLSARGREEDVTRAFSLGADDYMIKPFSPQELLARLGRLLR
jgi:DNA-binding response OmpR family regulator